MSIVEVGLRVGGRVSLDEAALGEPTVGVADARIEEGLDEVPMREPDKPAWLEMETGREVRPFVSGGWREDEMPCRCQLHVCHANCLFHEEQNKKKIVLYLNVSIHHNLRLVGSDKDTMTGLAVKVALALDDTSVLATGKVQLDTDPFTGREGCLTRTAHIAQVAIVLDSCADVNVHGLRSRVRHV